MPVLTEAGADNAHLHVYPTFLVFTFTLGIGYQSLGWQVDFNGKDDLSTALTSDLPDPDIGILKKPRLVSKVSTDRSRGLVARRTAC